MKKIIVTGGSGFIGTNLIEYIKNDYEVVNYDTQPPKISEHMKYWVKLDVTDLKELSRASLLFKPNFIIHLAARTDLDSNNLNDYESNIIGTKNILKVSKMCSTLLKVIFTSSKFVNPNGYDVSDQFDMNPHTAYGESKKIGEEYIWKNFPNCDWCIIRPTSIWGPYFQEPYRNFFDYIIKGYYFHIGNIRCYKTYGYIGNTVFQIKLLLDTNTHDINDKVFYLGDYDPYDIREWATEIGDEVNKSLFKIPNLIVRTLSYIGDIFKLFNIRFPLTSFRYKNMTEDGLNNLENITKIAPHLPFSRLEGTKITLEWLNKDDIKK